MLHFSLIKLLGERIATVRSEDALHDQLFTIEELRRLDRRTVTPHSQDRL